MDFDDYRGWAQLAADLVNTYSPVYKREDLSDSSALEAFLQDREVDSEAPVGEEELDQVRWLRGRLRDVFAAPHEAAAAHVLNGLLADSHASLRLTRRPDESWQLRVVTEPATLGQRLSAETAMALAVVIAAGGFHRLGVCAGEKCQDVFVDTSRNRSRRFCSPAVCGNRASIAAYRSRQREQRS